MQGVRMGWNQLFRHPQRHHGPGEHHDPGTILRRLHIQQHREAGRVSRYGIQCMQPPVVRQVARDRAEGHQQEEVVVERVPRVEGVDHHRRKQAGREVQHGGGGEPA